MSLRYNKDHKDEVNWEKFILGKSEPVLGPTIKSLYIQKKYNLVQQEIAKVWTIYNIPLTMRAMLGLCLIHRGDTGNGLREISLAYELTPNLKTEQKVLMLVYLLYGFALADQKYYLPIIIHQFGSNVRLKKGFKDVENYNRTTKEDPDNSRSSIYGSDYHQNSYLEEDTLKARMIRYHHYLQKVSDMIDENSKEPDLSIIFKSIIELMPFPSTEPFSSIRHALFTWEEEWFLEHYEFFEKDLDSLDSKILKPNPQLKAFNKIVELKTITSFMFLSDKMYEEATIGFNWILELYLNLVGKIFKGNFEELSQNEFLASLASENMRSIYLLSSYSTMHNSDLEMSIFGKNNEKIIMDIDHCITHILQHSEALDIKKEYAIGRLENYFIIIGSLYFERVLLSPGNRGTEFIDDFDLDILEESIRKFIIVSNLKLSDDSSILLVFDAILTAFILYGGLSVKVIWAFQFFKKLTQLKLTLNECVWTENYRLPGTIEILIEGTTKLIQSYTVKESYLTAHEKQHLFNESLKLGKGYEEVIHYSTLPFTKIKKLPEMKLKTVIDTDKEINKQEISSRFAKGDEFILLWVTTFKEYRSGEDFKVIKEYLQTLQIYID